MSANVKSEALDRVLEALAPALAAELDRIVQETREALEHDFQARLEAALREGERAVEQAKEDTRRELTVEMEQRFSERLENATAEVRNESAEERAKLDAMADQLKQEWSVERSKLLDDIERMRIFAEAQLQLAEASSQSEILVRFLMLAQPFAQGVALYVAKPDSLALWKSRGNGDFPPIVSQQVIDPDSYFRKISIRGKTVAAIYAKAPLKGDILNFLAATLERAIEVFGLKLRAPVPPSLGA